jgi:hypothetical protein
MGGLQKMSYSKKYHTSVQYSGSVSYSYPPSEHGGSKTIHYSGSVPIDVNITVNTEPFDGSVARFNTSINALGGSVVTMKAAQCAAIQQTAREVSAALINGFFAQIKTELSQQIQALDSAIKASFGLIQELGKAVVDKKNVMEGDYNRISSRYVKIFAELDNECYKRIYTLDKSSFTLSDKVQNQLLSESTSDTAAMSLLGIAETASSKTFVFVSSLNRKALEVIKTMHDYITQESRIESLINSFLLNEKPDAAVPLYVPVIWSESDILEEGAANRECHIPEYIDQQKKKTIAEKVNRFCSDTSQSKWKKTKKPEKESFDREFKILAESSFANADGETDQRIYRTMMSLWQNAELLSLERS